MMGVPLPSNDYILYISIYTYKSFLDVLHSLFLTKGFVFHNVISFWFIKYLHFRVH